MTNETRYNGWTNRETWAVKLWIDNEEASQTYWTEQAKAAPGATALADQLQEEHEDALPDLENGFASDLLMGALGRVNWDEIANSLIEDLDA